MNLIRGNGGLAYFGRNLDSAMVREDLLSQEPPRQINAIKQVIAFMTIGKDMSVHFNDVSNLVSSSNLEMKKLVYLYLMHNAKSQPEKAVLQAGTFVHDTLHDSPLIRGMALRTMSSMLIPTMVDFIHGPTLRCLRDSDPYVRRVAIFATLKLFTIAPSVCEDVGLFDVLSGLLGDPIASVVAAAVAATSELLQLHAPTKLAMAVLGKTTTLLRALEECTEWSQVYLLDGIAMVFAQKHSTLPPDEAEMIATRVVPLLSSSNPSVVMAALKVIVLFMQQYTGPQSSLTPTQQAQLETRFSPKLGPPLVSLVTNARFEIRHVALRNIKLFIQSRFRDVLAPYIQSFFVKFDDPIYLKLEKIDMLVGLANKHNAALVLSELCEYATEIDVELVRKAVRSIGTLAVKVEPVAPQCVERLIKLIERKIHYIVQECAVVVETILRQYTNKYESVIATLCNAVDVRDDPLSKAAVAWVIGEYADRIETKDAADTLSFFLDSFAEEPPRVQFAVLTAIVKTYLKGVEARPGQNRQVLEKVLKLCTDSTRPDVRDRAYFYWRLISADAQAAAKVILAPKSEITELPSIDKGLLQELLGQGGSVASVLHKPATLIFGDGKRFHGDDSDEDVPEEPTGPVRDPLAPAPTAAEVQENLQRQTKQPNIMELMDFGQGSSSTPAPAPAPASPTPAPKPGPAAGLATVLTAEQGK